jgi:hypothetical protein
MITPPCIYVCLPIFSSHRLKIYHITGMETCVYSPVRHSCKDLAQFDAKSNMDCGIKANINMLFQKPGIYQNVENRYMTLACTVSHWSQ